MSGTAMAIVATIAFVGACSSTPDPQPKSSSATSSTEHGTTDQIGFTCASAQGAEVDDAGLICTEILAMLHEVRPDLRFIDGGDDAPAVRFTITHSTPRGMGLEAIWIDAEGQAFAGRPLSTSFFDRSADPNLRRNFLATFLRENPIPF